MFIRSVSIAATLAALALLAGLTAVRAAPRNSLAPQTPACTTSWSAPAPLKFGKGHVHVGGPQVVQTHAGLGLLGDNALSLEATDSGFRYVAGALRGDPGMLAGYFLRVSGELEPMPAPPGVRAFVNVRAVAIDGVAHVFWGGSDDTSANQASHINAIWYARFDGRQWSTPVLALDTERMVWAVQTATVASANGRVHVLIPGDRPMDSLHYLTAPVGGDAVRYTRLPFPSLYADLLAPAGGTLTLATIDGDSLDRAKVVVRRSSDNGQTWSEPTTVYRSGRGTAYEPRLAVGPGDTLLLAWITESRDRRATSVAVATSADRGITWASGPALDARRQLHHLSLVTDGDGAVHAAFTSDSVNSLLRTRWERGAWLERDTVARTSFGGQLVRPVPDELYLVWTEFVHAPTEPQPAPMLSMSRRRPCPGISPER